MMMIATGVEGGRQPRMSHPPAVLMLLRACSYYSVWLVGSGLLLRGVSATVPCNVTNDNCAKILRPGSFCMQSGICSNPYNSGCLVNRKEGWTRTRVCNWDDPPDAGRLGICRPPEQGLDYMEIRIASQNWESVFFEAWVMQILLSEILDVPTTLETGQADANVNIYNVDSRFDYGRGNVFDGIYLAAEVGDCRKVLKQTTDPNKYVTCAHLIPEVWAGHEETIANFTSLNIIEPPSFIGVVGLEGWYAPQFTGARDPTLMDYHGLSGEANRRKLAERFFRPTNWSTYCTVVSSNYCKTPDTVAARAPLDDDENGRFFVEGLYTGHFRKTEDNDCDTWPTNCTGHIVDYPCGWASPVGPQLYHLKIALKSSGTELSGGYTYTQMSEIWQAANATKSDMVSMWWFPEAQYQAYLNTESQLEVVAMPPPSPECIAARIDPDARCGGTLAQKVGQPISVCADPPIPMLKVLSTGLYRETNLRSIKNALISPGYEAVKNFRISDTELSEIFDYWMNSVDKFGYGPREAVCRWVVENFDSVLGLVPRTYPRVLSDDTAANTGALFKVSVVFSSIAITVVAVSCLITYRQRHRRVIKNAQVEFMLILLVGLLLVSTASLIQAIVPTNPRCVSVIWLVNIGYTLELVPLIVKVAAINRLMQAAQKMRRVQLNRKSLFGIVALLCVVVITYLVLWTLLNPPRKVTDYTLTDTVTSEGQTVILTDYYCESTVPLWSLIAVGAQCLLLVCASVLAFQTRKLRKDMNETQTLAVLIYSHFMFVAMRITIIIMRQNLNVATAAHILSLIFSIDSIATVCIYFIPKFLWDTLSDESETAGTSRLSFSYSKNGFNDQSRFGSRTAFGSGPGSGAFSGPSSGGSSNAFSVGGTNGSATFSTAPPQAPPTSPEPFFRRSLASRIPSGIKEESAADEEEVELPEALDTSLNGMTEETPALPEDDEEGPVHDSFMGNLEGEATSTLRCRTCGSSDVASKTT